MLKNSLKYSMLLLCFCALPVNADELTLKDLTLPKPPAYRVGLSAYPEQQFIQAIEDATKPEKQIAQLDISKDSNSNIADLTYADLSIKRLSKEISQELQYEEKTMVADLSLLWQGAATQSDTINFALYKLANPDADKPDEKSIKKVLTTIASMSTLVGAGVGSPIIAGSSLIGGNILGIMGQDTKALNYKYTRVTDADMIILIRKVEDLQQKAVDLYYDYMSAKRQLEFMNDLVADRQRKFELAQKNNAARELIVITDAYYRTALEKQRSAKSEYFSKRAALEQFVGNETFVQFEQELAARENPDPAKEVASNPMPETDAEEYDNTVKTIENYTQNQPENNTSEEPKEAQKDLSDNNSSEQESFYSNFQTGYAAPVTLEEFFHPELMEKPKKQKTTKAKKQKIQKPKKEKAEKPAKEKQPKIKKEKTPKVKKSKLPKKEKQEKKEIQEKPINDVQSNQDNTTSWYDTWINEEKEEKLQEKQAKKAAKKQKLKNKKAKKEKIKNKKSKQETISDESTEKDIEMPEDKNEQAPENEQTTENNPITGNDQTIENETTDSTKKIKNKKEKKVKEKKPKKPKKEKDLYPELHGQKPIHKYPRNSEKDLIFLHGRDKHEAKKPSEMTEEEKKELKIRNEAYSREYRATRRERERNELLEEASLKPVDDKKSSRPVRVSPTIQQGQPVLQYDDNYQEEAYTPLFSKPQKKSKEQTKEQPKQSVNKPAAEPTRVEATRYVAPTQKVETSLPPLTNSPAGPVNKTPNYSNMNLPPLDAIKAPDLTKGGYSIHSY